MHMHVSKHMQIHLTQVCKYACINISLTQVCMHEKSHSSSARGCGGVGDHVCAILLLFLQLK
jgi:hypothetical protein